MACWFFFLWQMGVFCFPAGATLPLHDHPEMVVLSKLLYGTVRVRSYDWVAAPPCAAARKCASSTSLPPDILNSSHTRPASYTGLC